MTRLLPSVLSAAELPLTELRAAVLDGEVYAIDECFAPIDEVENAAARAAALLVLVGDRVIAERESALWIYGIREKPPGRHTLCVPRTDRISPLRTQRMVVRETRLRSGDTRVIGGLRVTSPVRTAFDLLRSATYGAAEQSAVFALFDLLGADVEACRTRISTVSHLPGARLALDRLDAVVRRSAGQPALTRYTS